MEGGRRLDPGEKLELDYGELGRFRIGPRLGSDLRQAHYRRIATAVVHEDAIAGPHGGNGAQRLGVFDPVPNRFTIALEVVDGVGFGVGLCQEVVHVSVMVSNSRGSRQNSHAATTARTAAPASMGEYPYRVTTKPATVAASACPPNNTRKFNAEAPLRCPGKTRFMREA